MADGRDKDGGATDELSSSQAARRKALIALSDATHTGIFRQRHPENRIELTKRGIQRKQRVLMVHKGRDRYCRPCGGVQPGVLLAAADTARPVISLRVV